jgi:hypothetical protein
MRRSHCFESKTQLLCRTPEGDHEALGRSLKWHRRHPRHRQLWALLWRLHGAVAAVNDFVETAKYGDKWLENKALTARDRKAMADNTAADPAMADNAVSDAATAVAVVAVAITLSQVSEIHSKPSHLSDVLLLNGSRRTWISLRDHLQSAKDNLH